MVELYTSEGCSSCPPADNFLRQLGAALDDDGATLQAVPLAFHVDYWNYLGWRDPFSKAAFTTRQREVPANRGRGIYTPEFVADGYEARGGNAVLRAIKSANKQKSAADIRLEIAAREPNEIAKATNPDAAEIQAQIQIQNRTDDAAHAFLAVYERDITRQIHAGENHGKTLKHDFIVRHWSRPIPVREGANETGMNVQIPADWKRENLGVAVVVVNQKTGRTVQAVKVALASLFSKAEQS